MTPQAMSPLIGALTVRAIHAYEREDASILPGLRSLGAVMALHGIAENGGLVGGGIENVFFSENMPSLEDAIAGLRWLALDDVAALVVRARQEYLWFRPTGWEELSEEGTFVWDQLDSAFFEIATLDRLETAMAARLHQIAPELLLS
ncbi:DMP19 family protein [Kineococcus sp. SYSU DK006]|uniref:DMP19 family protein n=1 Tax=Kineococcus sp. SYSU DK006 TaxID=3383127 RepID=UPI003D7D8856